MESNYNQMIKRPLLTMKILFMIYLVLTGAAALLGLLSITSGEPNYPVGVMAVFLAGIVWVTRHGYNELAKGTKRGWVISTVFASLCLPTIFFPLGVYALTGLMHRSVRSRHLDVEDENQVAPSLSEN
jgi:hypothetical protein